MTWKPARDKEKYGVAISNYSGEGELCIKLYVGDTVHIQEETEGWFFGYSFQNRALRGIFPKSFIHIRDCVVEKNGLSEEVTPRQPFIVQEVTSVLREWGILLRKLYLEKCKDFTLLKDTMSELIILRAKVLSGQLPGDELKTLKQRITRSIDRVNAKLGLDLVVRDESGNILNPDITSAVKLFRHHSEAAAKLSKRESVIAEESHTRRKPHLSWTFLLCIKNISIKIHEYAEISLALYTGDPREGQHRPLTESFIIPSTGNNQAILGELKCLFTDLNTHLLDSNQIWLIGTVIRHGCMAMKESDPRKSMAGEKPSTPSADSLRRPFGAIVMDLTDQIRKKKDSVLAGLPQMDDDECAPLYMCSEKDTMDLRKLMSARGDATRELSQQGLWFSVQAMNGDVKQLKESNCLEVREVPVAYRLGLSDVIMPGDVRNDLYVTLQSGEFSRGAKTSDRNVEVTVRICDQSGRVVPGVIHPGCRVGPLNEYRSVTYHHEPKPKWAETFKITLPIDEFEKDHIKFTFKHRSTNDAKDKSERPFAMSFVKLVQDNGTTLQNTKHDLIVYKIDNKKWTDSDYSYLGLHWQRKPGEELAKSWQHGIAPSLKDSFTISTIFCSTKLTQNAELLQLLEWRRMESSSGSRQNNAKLEACLQGLVRVPNDELMVFLQDTLDVLLDILMSNSSGDYSDNRVFEALVYVITIATDKNKHEAFQPVLETYIQENFHANLAYNKLIYVLKYYVQEGAKLTDDDKDPRRTDPYDRRSMGRRSGEEKELGRRAESMEMREAAGGGREQEVRNTEWQETLKKAMKCLPYLFRFIIRSRELFENMKEQGKEEFEKSLEQLLESMAEMMKNTSNATLVIQAQCLRYITTTIPVIITKFDRVKLSQILTKMVDNLNSQRIPKQQLSTIREIVHSALFRFPDCRRVLLPCFIKHLRRLMSSNDELELCANILGDILDVLRMMDIGPVYEDVGLLSIRVLEDILAIVARQGDISLGQYVSILVSLLRQMEDRHYHTFLNRFEDPEHLSFFLLELLKVINRLAEHPVFPSDWAEMILLQNNVFVNVLKQCAKVIEEKLLEPFKEKVWSEFFKTAINFTAQPSLQLANFTSNKRNKILTRYGDMRREIALVVKSQWSKLEEYKIQFVPGPSCQTSMVGPFLRMTMLSDTELRRATIPLFFSMMVCEFYSIDEKGKESGKVKHLTNEMLEKLDELVEMGHGDEHYRDLFKTLIGSLCESHKSLQKKGSKLVSTVTQLLDRLLQYRMVMNTPDNSIETRMGCIVNLLDFYSKINRKELYLRYVYKLCKLHLDCDNYTEASYSLMLHSNLLSWTPAPLGPSLKSPLHDTVMTHNELKERLYEDIIVYFDKGKMWEEALKLCKEMVKYYEVECYDYEKLSELLIRMAAFYKNIMNPQMLRPEPNYFRVAYYGRGFPAFLQNKVFVYRGNGYERLEDFTRRIRDQFPNAELMTKLTPPSEEAKESPHQYLQINNVDCITKPSNKITEPNVSEQIVSYYQVNHIDTFTYSRPFHQGTKDPNNEFATLCIEKTTLKTTYSLPGILRWFPVPPENASSVTLTPLENAIDTMTQTNVEVHELVRKYLRDRTLTLPLHPLTRKLSGVVDAAVMGGTENYEKAFLHDKYAESHPEDAEKMEKLRELLAEQIPLLEAGLFLHGNRVTEQMKALHTHLAKRFLEMKTQLQQKYGVVDMPADIKLLVQTFQAANDTGGHLARSSQHYHTSTASIALHDSIEVDEMNRHNHHNHHQSTTSTTSSGSPRNSFTRGLFSHSTLPHKSLFTGFSNSQMSLARRSIAKGGTLPRGIKIASSSNGGTPKSNKNNKGISRLLRRESFSSHREGSTQWFDKTDGMQTPPQQPILELSEQLMSQRPKKTELDVDKYYSTRPRSLTLTPTTPTTPATSSIGSRESLSTPTGSLCEEDQPPPLPMKQRDQDGDYRMSVASLSSGNKSLSEFPFDLPAEPPEKPPRPDKNHSLHGASSSSSSSSSLL
ncbi:dedicator of cytokinesis protein 1-like isoform X3 [Eriocheir sinensis]|uniref:dedicator of cytokinesis protein 1-like isoform X3 n=1 Tax=Eriocheir sinensis TaxID=95602 RepID=UPI0021C71B42|nr:dedicator of cytokinesis protein 1-like isoform X3 [Eriocheir sinensis]